MPPDDPPKEKPKIGSDAIWVKNAKNLENGDPLPDFGFKGVDYAEGHFVHVAAYEDKPFPDPLIYNGSLGVAYQSDPLLGREILGTRDHSGKIQLVMSEEAFLRLNVYFAMGTLGQSTDDITKEVIAALDIP